MEGKYTIVSGPVIIEDGKLLVIKDNKDNFYKIPGGTVEKGETPEETCIREFLEETNGKIEIIKPLNPLALWENPKTGEEMCIVLMHYLDKLKNKKEIKPIPPVQEIKWLDISAIKKEKYKIAPNIKYLIEKGYIK